MPEDHQMAPGEIARTFRRIEHTLRETNASLANLVTRREFDLRTDAYEHDMKEVKDDVAALKKTHTIEKRRGDDRRLLIVGMFVAPIVTGLVLTGLLAALRI